MKRLALTKDGRFTYCYSRDELIGKGRCNHIACSKIGENETNFKNRIRKELNMSETLCKIDNISKYNFQLPDNYFDKKTTDQVIKEYIHIAAVNYRLKEALKNDSNYFFQNSITIPNPDLVKKEMEKFSLNKENFEKIVDKFKEDHKDWYEEVPVQQTFKPSNEEKERAQKFVDSLETMDEKCFWFFKTKSEIDQYKNYMKNKAEFMTTKKQLKSEYKEKYNEFLEKARKESGYPGDAAIKNNVIEMIPSVKQVQLRAIEINVKESAMNPNLIWS